MAEGSLWWMCVPHFLRTGQFSARMHGLTDGQHSDEAFALSFSFAHSLLSLLGINMNAFYFDESHVFAPSCGLHFSLALPSSWIEQLEEITFTHLRPLCKPWERRLVSATFGGG